MFLWSLHDLHPNKTQVVDVRFHVGISISNRKFILTNKNSNLQSKICNPKSATQIEFESAIQIGPKPTQDPILTNFC